ncbi:MAG: Rpn family recombination-promoting nuclease/putative transposase [Nitrospirae bacterium]|uniref:Rpn family recombination-promoting nuclease/putative transposase n=1 Tax=Candidatus Magnetobacterium casense TaxID=1455061 RepID=UPI000699109F|nr:Rpn family recombination-promoting nuclease/putative transposase [Candidatus Magnetobacterium casensis]MBF0338472.1 Rpn family recombination-promoting nuclease/putative transposase [Nitrospirota bacterium]
MQFADVRSDIAFRKIFGNEAQKGILISFLNAVLDLSGDREIEDLSILNPYQTPQITILKETILDIRAVDKRGITFIVEIQLQKRRGFEKRVLYYTSKAYVAQLSKGEDYPALNQVIYIGILDFDIFEGDSYITRHMILNTKTLKQELKDFEFNFIELPKFKKTEDELESVVDKWIHFIKNAVSLEMIPKSADFDEIQAAYDTATMMLWSKDELEIYDYWQIRLQDERGAIEYSFLEGERKGKIEGLLEGERKGKLEGLLEGERKGKLEGLLEGERKGLLEGIEMVLEMKYGDRGTALMGRVRGLGTIEALERFKGLLKTSASVEELEGYFE